jgi:hypothetical protein
LKKLFKANYSNLTLYSRIKEPLVDRSSRKARLKWIRQIKVWSRRIKRKTS